MFLYNLDGNSLQEMESGNMIYDFREKVTHMTFDKEGKYFMVGSEEGKVSLWWLKKENDD